MGGADSYLEPFQMASYRIFAQVNFGHAMQRIYRIEFLSMKAG